MLFASPTFLFAFLPLCVAAYFALPSMRAKNGVLILASVLFYAWGEPAFLPLIAALTVFNYAAAILIDRRVGSARTRALAAACGVNLMVLAVVKYAGFLASSLNTLLVPAGLALTAPDIPLPLGISFFTFHCLSYLIDTFRGRFPANRRLDEVALYIGFFPQLIAGPIVRYKTIARRIRRRRHSLGRVSAGLRIFVIGLAQKTLVADALAPIADAVFDNRKAPGLLEAWLGAVTYALQLYFDFAGYSAMAIGLGVVFGFSLPRNFRTPYASTSITEFWRHWHISLSSWFRDYLYLPLGGNRGPAWQTWRNLIVVFLLCGLWHGANWTFVLWGAWHGAFLVLERAWLGRLLARSIRPLAWLYAAVVVIFGWVLFRSPDMARAAEVWAGMTGFHGVGQLQAPVAAALQPLQFWLLPLAAILAIFGSRLKLRLPSAALRGGAGVMDAAGALLLLALSMLSVASGTYSPFLYFRF